MHATLDMNLSKELAVFHVVFKIAGIYNYSENDLYGPWIELN